MAVMIRAPLLSTATAILLLMVLSVSAQVPDTTWTKLYGVAGPYEYFWSVEQLPDNGYILCGSWNEDLMLMRTDEQGDTIWTKIYGATGIDDGFSVIQTEDGGFMAVGLRATQNGDLWMLKTDANGDTLWTRTYGGAQDDVGFCVLQTDDGGYVIYGHTESLGGIYGNWLLRTDPAGDTLWTKVYQDFATCPGISLHATDDGGYIFTACKLNGIAYEAYMIRTDSLGDTAWTHRYCGLGNDMFISLTPTAGGGFVAAGCTGQITSLIQDAWILKSNSAGDSLWAFIYGGQGHEELRSVKQTPDGGFIVAGPRSLTPFAESYVWLMKLDATGDSVWARIWHGGDAAECSAVDLCNDGGYILAGSAFLLDKYDDAWLLKTEPDVGINESNDENAVLVSLTVCPNPFSKLTVVGFGIKHYAENIEMVIYDAAGRRVRTLYSAVQHPPCSMWLCWDGTDDAHQRLKSGVYLCELRTSHSRSIKKIVLIE